MPVIPPWINVNPKDFVEAARAGGDLGANISQIRTRADIDREQIASAERQNAARIAAGRDESAAANALREWEEKQQILMGQSKLDQAAQDRATQIAMERERIDNPIYRTVENQVAQIDPRTGKATSIFTAPFRPRSSALDELLSGAPPASPAAGTIAPEAPQQQGPGFFSRLIHGLFGGSTPEESRPNGPITVGKYKVSAVE